MRVLPLVFAALLPVMGTAADAFVVGACTHFGQGKGLLRSNLSVMRQAGIASLRDEVGWRAIEKTKGRLEMPPAWDEFVDESVKAGIAPLIILDYGNPLYDNGDKPRSAEAIEAFARYAEFVVRHFRGRVRLYELWNEWDIAIGSKTPGSADDYVTLIKTVYPRIKAADPSITVLGGSPTPGGVKNGWLARVLENGGLRYMDALSIHTYTYSESGRARGPEAWAEWMAQVESMGRAHNSGRDVPMYVTETGWPTQIDRRGTPPEVAAAYIARLFLLARTLPYVKGVWWYDFQDDGWNTAYNENNFGLVRPDLSPKPAFHALAAVAPVAARGEFVERIDTGDPDVWALRFREPNSGETLALWSAHPDDDWEITLESARPNAAAVRAQAAGRSGYELPWGARAWADGPAAVVVANQLQLIVRGVPLLVSGGIEGVAVKSIRRREAPELTRSTVYLQ